MGGENGHTQIHEKFLESSFSDSEEVSGEEIEQEVAGSAYTRGENCSWVVVQGED